MVSVGLGSLVVSMTSLRNHGALLGVAVNVIQR